MIPNNESLARLYARALRGARTHDLEPMIAACRCENDPGDAFDVVHVAGTNGKGSVAATVASILRAAGIAVGLYTSPHLERFYERMQINGVVVDEDTAERWLTYVLDRHADLTFFEATTLVAFLIFREVGVRVAVLETGLGGRLDATNVVGRTRVAAITTIGFDHTELLGDTITAIAREKAGILRPAIPIVTGRLSAEADDVVVARAAALGAKPLWRLGREVSHIRCGAGLLIRLPGGVSFDVDPRLHGAHQDDNAAVAVAAAWQLRVADDSVGAFVDAAAVRRGVRDVRWPGRFEALVVPEGPLAGGYLLDAAHNEDGARALASAIRAATEIASPVLVFGAMADKAWTDMVRLLAPMFRDRVYVSPSLRSPGRIAVPPADLRSLDADGLCASTVREALALARGRAGLDSTVVVAGSLCLVGEVRSMLLGHHEGSHAHVGL